MGGGSFVAKTLDSLMPSAKVGYAKTFQLHLLCNDRAPHHHNDLSSSLAATALAITVRDAFIDGRVTVAVNVLA